MTAVAQLKDQLLRWALKFPLDRDYRKAHNIAFGSEAHKNINQVDVYLEFLEERLYKEIYEEAKQMIEMEEQYKKGIWLRDNSVVDEEEAIDLFDRLKVTDIKS